jgi:hypothetical protein
MDECLTAENFGANCANRQLRTIGVDTNNVTKCMDDSFVTKGDANTDNKLFKEDRMWSNRLGIVVHPSLTINNITYRGDITGYDIFRAICAGFHT